MVVDADSVELGMSLDGSGSTGVTEPVGHGVVVVVRVTWAKVLVTLA